MNFRTKIVDECMGMREFLLNWNFGRRIRLKENGIEKPLADILFPLMSDEDLWDAFNKLKTISSQPIG